MTTDQQLTAIQAQAQAATRPETAAQTADRAGLLLLATLAIYPVLPPAVLSALASAGRRQLGAVLAAYRSQVRRALPAGMMRAATLAVHDVAKVSGGPVGIPVVEDPSDLDQLFSDAEGRLARLLAVPQLRAAPEVSIRAATAVAVQAIRNADATLGDTIHRSYADASHHAAEQDGVWRIWKAERNACSTCLAYAGYAIAPGKLFPTDLTFGDRPINWRGFTGTGAPRHPYCRCIAVPIDQAGIAALGAALRREAQRSIIKGFALPSESVAARARAADRLLKRGSVVPRSVQDAAARRLADGTFITGPVPRPTIK